MTDRPILFSAPMVRAILREVEQPGTGKTQTRRILLAHPEDVPPKLTSFTPKSWNAARPEIGSRSKACRFAKGDRLWVRESWLKPYANTDTGSKAEMAGYIYRADGPEFMSLATQKHQWGADQKWRASIHMPREASRLTLTVTDVRVQRLQEISRGDAIAEGIEEVTKEIASRDKSARFWKRYRDGGWNSYVDCPIGSYASLWTEINGAGSWDVNPWVCAVSFNPERRNIDQ